MNILRAFIVAAAWAVAAPAFAEPPLPVVGSVDAAVQRSMLESADPRLEANKTLVFDMWRTLIDARQVAFADRFLAEEYIQHNPMAQTGRAGFVSFFAQEPPTPIQEAIRWRLYPSWRRAIWW